MNKIIPLTMAVLAAASLVAIVIIIMSVADIAPGLFLD